MKTVRVVAAVIREKDKIFATARGYGEFKGQWEFPGGKIEPGETPQEASKREIKEELATEIEVGELIHTIEYDYPTFHLSMDCFWCSVKKGTLTLLEAEAAKWLTKDSLRSVQWLPADLELIDRIERAMTEKEDYQGDDYHNMENQTIAYYNQNAASFIQGTVSVDFQMTQDKFLNALPGKRVLDFGCGSGRDTKYFLGNGLAVTALDGSEELCKYASAYTGIPVKNMIFQDLDEMNQYDGIWACSSILHLPKKELKMVFHKMVTALDTNGIIYTSFKYGTFEGERSGRFFTDFTQDTFSDFIKDVEQIRIEEEWLTDDVRPGREREKWLNLILKKTGF